MIRILITAMGLFFLSSMARVTGTCTHARTADSWSVHLSKVLASTDTETLKKKLKSQICSFLTEDQVGQLLGVAGKVNKTSGYDGTTGHYCSYNWNHFTCEARFAYVFSTIGKPGEVARSLQLFRESTSLQPARVAVAGVTGAFWNPQSSRLTVFFSDVQLYIDMRKTDFPDKKDVSVQLIETALRQL